jgi:hypothetical protein
MRNIHKFKKKRQSLVLGAVDAVYLLIRIVVHFHLKYKKSILATLRLLDSIFSMSIVYTGLFLQLVC